VSAYDDLRRETLDNLGAAAAPLARAACASDVFRVALIKRLRVVLIAEHPDRDTTAGLVEGIGESPDQGRGMFTAMWQDLSDEDRARIFDREKRRLTREIDRAALTWVAGSLALTGHASDAAAPEALIAIAMGQSFLAGKGDR